MFGGIADIFFPDNLPVMDKSACLNRRNRFEPCALCETVCTFGALSISAGLVSIDAGKCTGCGLCSAVCPSEALKLKDYRILRSIAGNNKLRCMKSGGIICLKSLSPSFAAAVLVISPAIKLVMPCENCALSEKFLPDNLNIAMKFLDALGVSHDVEIISDENFEEGLSRRELLSSFFTWGKNKGSNIIEDVIWHNQSGVFLARNFLADSLKNKSGHVEAGVFYDFSVSEGCNVCGFCEALCPSGAWNISKNDGKATLSFDTLKCSGCMMCVKKCHENAIIFREKFAWPVESSVKFEASMIRCRHCGKWFVQSKPEIELCAQCSK